MIRDNDKQGHNISISQVSFFIHDDYYNRLKKNYIHGFHSNIKLFNIRLFNLLCRYNTLYSPGYQATLPSTVFSILNSHLKVEHEIFASPFNVTLNKYTSAYNDTDYHFGSKGNFFEKYETLLKKGGSFEVNPPFIEEHMIMTSIIINYTLKTVKNGLSFIVIIPTWIDSLAYKLLYESEYNILENKEILLDRLNHYYINGGNYEMGKVFIKEANNNTSVFILQNEAGKKDYEISPDFITEFTKNFQV
jgi:hypothetical protein